MDTNSRYPAKSGQAMVEFCIGLIGMLAVIAGIFQLGLLGLARTDARVAATRSATMQSMLGSDITGLSIPPYIRRVSESTDGMSFSEDDTAISGDEQAVYNQLLEPSRPDLLRTYAPDNDLAEMDDPFDMMVGMGLVQGSAGEFNLPVLPIVRRLFFDQPTVDIQVSVWMVRTGELY